ncbi:Major facilitator superfamily transporter [Metarhizium guizhouense ARSEF 977]|uniref:Major facilitator superfamily transporter n=1 Tax=Metarhizium guizhouense (strain ARSEF 977) TaxID=1276136 RepID=A0A0B4H1A3_METGA|nr:Major facilitator superfamily transporter [Metarhizium guizhouense ARSEF 977]
MSQPSNEPPPHDADFWVPGTIALKDLHRPKEEVMLHPVPTTNPNDPLNWAAWRKHLNFSLVSFYVLLTFVQLDIGFTAWGQYQDELNFSIDLLNAGAAINYGGLAIGCIFFVPLVHRYGRRPVYLLSTLLQLVSCVWFAVTHTRADFIGSNLITIADLFFIHRHALMNGWYLFFTFTGAYLGPVASGYIVEGQGWRWMWWWCVILFGVNLVLVVFLFEESKFINGVEPTPTPTQSAGDDKHSVAQVERGRSAVRIDRSIPLAGYQQRMAWSQAAGRTCCTTFATYLFSEPYNFTAAGVGLMNVAPFIGTFPGIFLGGWMNDKSIVWLARRNGGIYEPEMRLWLALPMAVITPAGILMCGVGLAYGSPWPLVAVGYGIFGFGLVVAGDIALSYAMDCYHDIIGNALVGVIFTRNAFSVVVLFALTPWISGMGLRNVHILVSMLCFAILLIPVILLIWGKKFRAASAKAYMSYARRQPTHRDV